MDNFFTGLKRHRIARVGAAYALVAWFLIQLVNNLAPLLLQPTLVLELVLVTIAIGFPIALVVAWTLEPHTADKPANALPSAAIDLVLAAGLVSVLLLLIWQQV